MKTIETKELLLLEITPHPYNREFPTRGEEWDRFAQDVAEHGILEELVVRVKEDGYECLKGHRRRQAGIDGGITVAVCRVVAATDEEAFALLWEGNDFRLNHDPVDEARYVCGLRDLFHLEVEEVAQRMRHDAAWVRDRQMLLELGDEVLEAVRRPGPDRLTMGAVSEILKVPREWWLEAVQLVLVPDLDMYPLSKAEAAYEIRKELLEPRAREKAWEENRERYGKAWRKKLEKLCQPGTKADLMVHVRSLKDAETQVRGAVAAEANVDLADLLPDAPEGVLWLHLAVRHGLPVQIVPGGDKDAEESQAVVNVTIVRDAEAAAASYLASNPAAEGLRPWLVTGKKRVVSDPSSVMSDGEKRSLDAQALLDGEGERDYETEEKPQVVIEQGMEHHAFLDMGAVKRVAMWAVMDNADPMNAPDFVPKWACRLGVEGLWMQIDEVCAWVLSLKKK